MEITIDVQYNGKALMIGIKARTDDKFQFKLEVVD